MKMYTQIKAAQKGYLTRQMKNVLNSESIDEDTLLKHIADGRIVIPANKNHFNLKGVGIGSGLRTKINVNLGVSQDCFNPEMELKKVDMALQMKTDAIMDLSIYGNTRKFRQMVIEKSPVMVGSVPVYDAMLTMGKSIKNMTVDDFFQSVQNHIDDGVDFLTIHAGLRLDAVERLKHAPRLTHIVSRGGSILLEWMMNHEKENPFYEYFDRLLEMCYQSDVTLSLGDGLRPGCQEDATDAAQIQELIYLGELAVTAKNAGVQVMIEGPGHVPIHEIKTNVQLEKKLCHGAPFYVLGPLVTDVAPGYDHITSAIGGAIAAAAGADFLCYVTPAEHLRLPTLDDMKEGIVASRIAAHAADIAKGIPGAAEWDREMSRARKNLDWTTMFELAIDSSKARKYRENQALIDEETCSMCGELCAVKKSREILETL